MDILHRDTLTEGGFAGLKEHRLIKNPIVFGPDANSDGSWPGLGNFVYLADARFMPHGETRMHNHMEIDVISIMVKGNISHQGSMGHGQDLQENDIQIQRAGGEGFSHNEVNPDEEWNRMIQLWVMPEQSGQAARYKTYTPAKGNVTHIYGGVVDKENTFPSKTQIDVALLNADQEINIDKTFIAYLCQGTGDANGNEIQAGDLMRGDTLHFQSSSDTQLIVIYLDTSL